jgi:hypothetical protein
MPITPLARKFAHRRRGVDRLVGVVVADQVAPGAEHPQVPSGCRSGRRPLAGGRVTALDHLGLPVAVEIGQRRGGEPAVGGEERPSREHRAVGGVDGVLVLVPATVPPLRSFRSRFPTARKPARRGARSGRGVLLPQLGTRVVEGVVTADTGLRGVAGTDEHVVGSGCRSGCHRRGRVDGAPPVWAGHPRPPIRSTGGTPTDCRPGHRPPPTVPRRPGWRPTGSSGRWGFRRRAAPAARSRMRPLRRGRQASTRRRAFPAAVRPPAFPPLRGPRPLRRYAITPWLWSRW